MSELGLGQRFPAWLEPDGWLFKVLQLSSAESNPPVDKTRASLLVVRNGS